MPPLFRLTDGTATVNLNSGSILTTSYAMASPEVNEEVIQNLGDGDTLASPNWGNVVETLELLITGADAAAVRDSIQSIEKLLDKARQNRLTWRGVRVWIEVQFDHDGGVWWRSEVLAGRLTHKQVADEIWRAKVETALIITRRYFWEGPETQVQLTSAGTGSPTTGYATVYNNDDASANTNWFQVAAAQVTGVLPAPLKLEINNASGSDRALKTLHLGNYVHMNPTSIDPIMRADQAAIAVTSVANEIETLVYRWALAKTLLDDLAGQYCRVLVAFTTVPSTNSLLRAKLQDNVGAFADLVIGEQVRGSGDAVLDLGAMPIPPGGAANANNTTYLAITLQAPTVSGDSVAVDWVQIMPAGFGLYRHIRGVYNNVPLNNGQSIIENGIDGNLYITDGTNQWASYRGIHAPLHVWPGVNNRFRLMKQGNGTLNAGEAYGLKAWVRPRRLTL